MRSYESVAAELEAIAATMDGGGTREEVEGRMCTAHDALLALGRQENRGRAVTVALLVGALRGGAPPHPGMAQKLRAVAADLRRQVPLAAGEGGPA